MGRQLSRRCSLQKQIPICYRIIYLFEKDHSDTLFPRSGFQAWLPVASVVMPPWCSHGRTGEPQWGPERVRVEGSVARASSWNQPPRPIRMKEQLQGSHGFVTHDTWAFSHFPFKRAELWTVFFSDIKPAAHMDSSSPRTLCTDSGLEQGQRNDCRMKM